MGRYGDLDYERLAKLGFLCGVALFALGAGGELVGTAIYGSLPAWETTLFVDLEVIGILAGLFSPLVFGIIMPLTE